MSRPKSVFASRSAFEALTVESDSEDEQYDEEPVVIEKAEEANALGEESAPEQIMVDVNFDEPPER